MGLRPSIFSSLARRGVWRQPKRRFASHSPPPPPPPRKPPVPNRAVPPPKRPSNGSGGGGAGGRGHDMVPAPPPMNQNSVAKLNLVGGDNSRAWNLVWLFGGLTFAGYVVSMVPQRIQFLKDQQQSDRALSAAEVRRTTIGDVPHRAIQKAHKFLIELRVTPRQLDRAIRQVVALNVAGTGLSEVLQEFLLGGVGDGLDGAESTLGYGACEGALKAALITAERLAAAGLLEIEITAPVSSTGNDEDSFNEPGEHTNEELGMETQQDATATKAWSDAHSMLLLCLVARNCGATESEAVRSIVQALQFEGVVDAWMDDAVLDSLRYIDSLTASTEVGEMQYDDSTDVSHGDTGSEDFASPPPFPSVASERV